ncbi:PAS domain S-box protein [Methanoregula sp.]|uniref:PAS domain S-box protein n=1 Tax=Methanoregula sp. TaxID=2052170 RepID=UPI003C759496
MQIFAFLSLISSILVLALGIFVYSTNRKIPLNQVFLLICMLAFYWTFMESMLRDADTISSAYVWMKLTFLWVFLPAAGLHFILLFTKSDLLRRGRWIYVLVYAPAAFFSIIELTTNQIITTPVLKYWGYTYGYSPYPLPFLVELVWVFGILVVSVLICIRYYFLAPGIREKNQTKFILTGFSVVIIAGFMSQVIFPAFKIMIPESETIFFLFFSGMIGYAIQKHELFVINPAMAADNIVSTMTDSLILLDNSRTIISVNEATLKILRCHDKDLIGRPFSAIFSDPRECDAILSTIAGTEPVTDLETAYRSKGGTIIPISFSGSVIRNANGERTGIVCISRDITRRKLLEESLRENEKRFRDLAELLPQTIFEIDLQGGLSFVNRAGLDIFGIDDEMIRKGVNVREYLIPEDFERMRKGLERVMSGTPSSGEIYHLKRLDGTQMCAIVYTGPIHRDGIMTGFRGIVLDITDRVKLEVALTENTELLTGILQASPVGVFRLDSSGQVIFINETFTRITGIPFETIRGTYWADFLPQADRDRVLRDIGESIRKRRTIRLEARYIYPDGTLYWLFSQTVPLIDNEGRLNGWVGTITDITEQKLVEDALKESEEKYRALTENTPDILFSTDMDGIITYASPQVNKYGYLEEEVIGKSLHVLVHPADIRQLESKMSTELEKGAQFVFRFRILDKWGNVYWCEEKSFLRLDLSGKPIGIYGILRDVTEGKRIEDAIEIANKKLNLMNQITRHDILNTITGLLGCVDMAKATTRPELKDQLLNDIRDLTRVIQRHIAFTREYQEVGVHLAQWQNVNDVIKKVLQNFEKSGITFSSDFEKMEIYADPLLEKVFYNLVDNAIRYGETLTTISIYPTISDTGFSLVFEDNGVGVEAGQKREIFKRGVGKNTGMGLFLTAEILAITGISIEENGIFGKGARFEIRIPNGTWRFPKD